MKQPYLFMNMPIIATATKTTSMNSDTPIATVHIWSHEGSKIVKNLNNFYLEITKIQSNSSFNHYKKIIVELTTND